MEPGVSLCFRGFRGGRRKAGHCGQCADARFVSGNEVKERAPQLCVEGLSAWGAHQAWAVSANSSQPSRLSPQAACPPDSSGWENHAAVPQSTINVLLSVYTRTHLPCQVPAPSLPQRPSPSSPFHCHQPGTCPHLSCLNHHPRLLISNC